MFHFLLLNIIVLFLGLFFFWRPLLTHHFPPHPMGCCQFSTIVHSVSKSLCWRPPAFYSPSRQWQSPKGLIAGDKCM